MALAFFSKNIGYFTSCVSFITAGRMRHSKFLIVKIMLFCFSGIAKTKITLDAHFTLYIVSHRLLFVLKLRT